MEAIVKSVFTAPLATLFIVAGMLFLLIAVIGNISGKIEPGERARMASGVIGLIFLCLGLTMHFLQKTSDVPESPVISTLQSKTDQGETPSEKSRTGSETPKQEPMPRGPSAQKQEPLNSPIQTIIDGVVASIIRFDNTSDIFE
jgi:hypothetical protein